MNSSRTIYSKCRGSYWLERSLIADDLINQTRIERKISIQSLSEHSDDREAWYKSDEAKKLLMREGVLRTEKRLFIQQAERVTCDDLPTRESRRWFMHFFTRSPNGLGVIGGRRDTTVQGNFRKCLIEAQNAKHPNHVKNKLLWCPITCTWTHQEFTTAAHIFPWKHGQETMTKIFGPGSEHEMFSAKNGIVMSTLAETRMDKGLFVIVPLINDESAEEVNAWHKSGPKRYQLRVLDKNNSLMQEEIPGSDPKMEWADLDGQELQFRSEHRPRARYLYYCYCVSMLRRCHHQGKHEEILKDYLGRKFWGIPGAYLRRSYLLAFVKEIGAQDILDGVEERDEEDDGEDPAALVVANEQIRSAYRPRRDVTTIKWQRRSSEDD